MTKQKRVCEITGSYFARDPRVRREAEALADGGWDVDVICLRAPNEPATSEYGNIHVRRIPLQHKRGSRFRYFFEYATFMILASLILSVKHLQRRYDLVHIHTMPDALVFVAWLPKLTRTPIVLDIHDPMPEIYQARFGISRQHWLNHALMFQERMSFSFADHLIVTHDLMPRLFARSTSTGKISSIMNVPDPRLFRRTPKRQQTMQDPFTLIYTGTITFTYDLDVVIHAFAKLRETIRDLCLRIIGEGDDLERVKALVTSLKLSDHVEFLPAVSLDQIPQMLNMSDVSVVPHRNDAVMPWGFSTKLAEALFVGVPVIAARTPALTTFFDDTMIAYFEPGNDVELADHVLRLYRDPTLGEQMVRNAQKFFVEHSWDHERTRFYDVMENLQRNSKNSYHDKRIA